MTRKGIQRLIYSFKLGTVKLNPIRYILLHLPDILPILNVICFASIPAKVHKNIRNAMGNDLTSEILRSGKHADIGMFKKAPSQTGLKNGEGSTLLPSPPTAGHFVRRVCDTNIHYFLNSLSLTSFNFFRLTCAL